MSGVVYEKGNWICKCHRCALESAPREDLHRCLVKARALGFVPVVRYGARADEAMRWYCFDCWEATDMRQVGDVYFEVKEVKQGDRIVVRFPEVTAHVEGQ